MLGALEHEAQTLGYRGLRLQTGAIATPALALYHASGYRRTAPFGRYRDKPLAVAFEKRLADEPGGDAASAGARASGNIKPTVAR